MFKTGWVSLSQGYNMCTNLNDSSYVTFRMLYHNAQNMNNIIYVDYNQLVLKGEGVEKARAAMKRLGNSGDKLVF